MSHSPKDRRIGEPRRATTRLLTRREERRLIRRVRRGRRAQGQLDRRSPMARSRRKRLARLVAGGRTATEQVVLANQGLVYSIANRYRTSSLALEDLVQEGNIGLLEAIHRFDPNKGTRFSTYATWWVRQSVARSIDQKGRLIRLPVCQEERRRSILRVQRELEQQLNREPTAPELAERLQLPVAEVELLLRISQPPLSLDQPLDDQAEGFPAALRDIIADPDSDVVAHLLFDQQRETIGDVLEELPPREARILELRFGLRSGQDLTFDEIGRRFGLTRERVRQLQNVGLDRLRDPDRRKRLEAC